MEKTAIVLNFNKNADSMNRPNSAEAQKLAKLEKRKACIK